MGSTACKRQTPLRLSARRATLVVAPIIAVALIVVIVLCEINGGLRDDAVLNLEEISQPNSESIAADESVQSVEILRNTDLKDMPEDVAYATGCPFTFQDAYEDSVRHNRWGTGWTYISQRPVDEQASVVLTKLREQSGWELTFASSLDLCGEAWGCVSTNPERGETMLVYMLPQMFGQTRGENNPLVMHIARINHAG